MLNSHLGLLPASAYHILLEHIMITSCVYLNTSIQSSKLLIIVIAAVTLIRNEISMCCVASIHVIGQL